MKQNKKAKQFIPKDLDLSQLQSPPYRIVYVKSKSPTATDMTINNCTRNGQNLDKTDYAKLLNKQFGSNR